MQDKVIGRFQARDGEGKTYTILEIQEYEDAGNLNDPNATVEGMRRLETSDGEDVIILDGEMCLAASHEVLRKIGG